MKEDITPNSIIHALADVGYFIDIEVATVLFLAIKLEKPILIEGPAGVGKTALAQALAQAYHYEFIRLQCYEGIDETKALYDWDYSKQLLYTQLLKEKVSKNTSNKVQKELSLEESAMGAFDSLFFSKQFLLERPLLKAIRNTKKSLLLIDEIDKSEPEFEAFLLELLSEFRVTIPEIGTLESKQKPLVIMTSNNERTLSDPLRRRALYLYIDYPKDALEKKIILHSLPDMNELHLDKLLDILHKIRSFPLKKQPGVSETLEWVKALVLLGGITIENLKLSLPVLSKHKIDMEYIRARIEDIL